VATKPKESSKVTTLLQKIRLRCLSWPAYMYESPSGIRPLYNTVNAPTRAGPTRERVGRDRRRRPPGGGGGGGGTDGRAACPRRRRRLVPPGGPPEGLRPENRSS